MEMTPMMIPILAISFCCTKPVAKARAFGGVEMGSIMALEAAMATPMRTVGVPPIGASLSPIAPQTIARMGISSAAVAEFEIKFDSR